MKIMEQKTDGWANFTSNLGVRGKDKKESTEYCRDGILRDETLGDMYNSEGLGAQIVDMLPNDMTKNGWTIDGDEKDLIRESFKDLMVEQKLNTALKYARLFRGSVVVIFTEKGALEEPLPDDTGQITGLKVYSAARIKLLQTDVITDPKNKYFDDFEIFKIRLRNGDILPVHNSRCLIFKGALASDNNAIGFEYRYWGLPIFQKIMSRLVNYSTTESSIASVMQEMIIGKFKMEGLSKMLASNTKDSINKIYERIELINYTKSVINSVLMGSGEEYTRDTANLSGVAEIVDRQMMNLAAVADYPVTKLFGRSAAGMSATGEGDFKNYYDTVTSAQGLILLPELKKLVDIQGKALYVETREFKVEFNPLVEMTEKENAEIYNLNSQADEKYFNMGVVDEEEIRSERFPESETRS